MLKAAAIVILLVVTSRMSACAAGLSESEVGATGQAAIQGTAGSKALSTASPTPSEQPTLTATNEPTATATLAAGSSKQSVIDGMIQLFVPAGAFLMGSPAGDPDVFPHERPQHRLHLDAFWIDQTEVSNRMYAECVAAGTCTPPRSNASNTRESYYGKPEFKSYPVVWIEWSQAQAYCSWAGRRLPTEAEWQKAARGAEGQYHPWGDEPVTAANIAAFEDASSSCARPHYGACKRNWTYYT